MRREIRWLCIALLAVTLGVLLAVPFARLSAPYLLFATRTLAATQPWKVESVAVTANGSGLGAELRLQGDVYRRAGDRLPAARVEGRMSVGEAVETPVVFWGMMCLWPAGSLRRRGVMLASAVPVFLILVGALDGLQLLYGMADASAVLEGHGDALTLWERASQFLEIGGLFAVDLCAALLVIAVTREPPSGSGSGRERNKPAPG
jgi:hypothetical protein